MIPYILHVGVILACCLIFYKALLQKETFYQLNRFVLLSCLVLSFILPLLPIPQQLSLRKSENMVSINSPELISSFNNTTVQQSQTAQVAPVDEVHTNDNISFHQVMIWLTWLYWFGVAAFGITFFIQVITLLSRVYAFPVIKDGRFTIVELPGDKAPCSFGNIIFINPEKYDWGTYNQILLHEKIHIQHKHSLDILLAEIVLIFQWFNPFAWLYRKELENNLEFLTDDLMLTQGKVDKTSYQMNLLQVSAPHFPLSLTTNYNQSLLKKRVIMMTAKKSNVNTSWKYLFLLPVLVISVCLLNKPIALAQSSSVKKNPQKEHYQHNRQLQTEGVWFATIKNDKLSIQFKNDGDDGNSFSGSTFPISEFKDFQREKPGTFTLTRDAGTMQFTGKFEGDQGMGHYKFIADKGFNDYLHKEGIDADDNQDMMVFFMVDVRKSYVQMLKDNGYTNLRKNDLIPLASLKVDAAYIQSLKSAGLKNISLQDLIPLKSMGITGDYIRDIRKAGYANVSANQLITFKSQGIDGKYLADIRRAAKKEDKPLISGKASDKNGEKNSAEGVAEGPSAEDIVALRSLNIDADYIRSLKEAGYDNLASNDLIAMKTQGITADYIKNFRKMGYNNMSPWDLITTKTQNITAEYIKSFEDIGYKNISLQDVKPLKSFGVTSQYIKNFQDIGYKNISFQDVMPLKSFGVTSQYIKNFQDIGFKDITLHDAVRLNSQGITADLIQQYKKLGFANVSLEDVISAKAMGTTPSFISSMKEKGHNLKSIQKYIQLKMVVE